MILFQKIKWKNFLSTGAHFTEIDFTKSNNTLIIGHNGAGKSTILDALCFGLFGKPFRKINKPQLLNSVNGKEAVVEVQFNIGQKKYKVIRGIKPNVFEIYLNDVLLNQDAAAKDYQEILENNILKLNYKSFTQVVILGSASFVPFMQLSASDRRAIIEDLLDIQIFSSMNNVIKEKNSAIKEELNKAKYAISLTEEKITLQKQNIEEHKKNHDADIKRKLEEIEKSKQQMSTLQNDIVLINKHIAVLQNKVGDKKDKLDKKSKSLFQIKGKVQTNIDRNQKEIDFYENNHDCPTCKQSITPEWKDSQVQEKSEKILTQKTGLFEIEQELNKVTTEMKSITDIITHISEHSGEIIKHTSTMSAIRNYISKLNKENDKSTNKQTATERDDQ